MWRQFSEVSEMPFNDLPSAIPQSVWLWVAKLAGAVIGSAISIAYLVPKGRREAATRFAVGLLAGMIFGPLVGIEISHYLDLSAELSRLELVMMGSASASLCAWWALGILHRFASRYGTTKL